MFYDAMSCDGGPEMKAKYMYRAVRLFGPKWDTTGSVSKGVISLINAIDQGLLSLDLDLDINEL